MENEIIIDAPVMQSKPLPNEFTVIMDSMPIDSFDSVSIPRPVFTPDVPKADTLNLFTPNTVASTQVVMQTMALRANAPRTDPSFNPEGVVYSGGVIDYTAETANQANTGAETYTRGLETKGTDVSMAKTAMETAKTYAIPIVLGVAGVGLLCWALMGSGTKAASERPVSGLGAYEPVKFKR